VVNAILDALVVGDAVRVSGLGIFNVAAARLSRGDGGPNAVFPTLNG